MIVFRTEGEIRKKLKELEENKEEITQTHYSESKRIGLHADIKMLRWVLGEEGETEQKMVLKTKDIGACMRQFQLARAHRKKGKDAGFGTYLGTV